MQAANPIPIGFKIRCAAKPAAEFVYVCVARTRMRGGVRLRLAEAATLQAQGKMRFASRGMEEHVACRAHAQARPRQSCGTGHRLVAQPGPQRRCRFLGRRAPSQGDEKIATLIASYVCDAEMKYILFCRHHVADLRLLRDSCCCARTCCACRPSSWML